MWQQQLIIRNIIGVLNVFYPQKLLSNHRLPVFISSLHNSHVSRCRWFSFPFISWSNSWSTRVEKRLPVIISSVHNSPVSRCLWFPFPFISWSNSWFMREEKREREKEREFEFEREREFYELFVKVLYLYLPSCLYL